VILAVPADEPRETLRERRARREAGERGKAVVAAKVAGTSPGCIGA
jgi:hypothetical protein